MQGLMIKREPLAKILAGQKTWEMRSTKTKKKGLIALIESKSGCVMGAAQIVGWQGPLSPKKMREHVREHAGSEESIASHFGYKNKNGAFAWILKDARRFAEPIPYRHPSGAVIWVTLDDQQSLILERYEQAKPQNQNPTPC